ncbi:YceI family protein [Chitinophagaceae bacterium LB-8]|uniref:YceI family protein n=1 Tax=Paraflavisolibacter caeni TaxID=2982496 RepID=A0A9X2XPE7_9BACT|nr:YceI family protein [Paraflavisolibacter caeni]MCU7550694.1 YceI family protein [Paraflavisolibacter caeni]
MRSEELLGTSKFFVIVLLAFTYLPTFLFAQTNYQSSSANVTISGTSSLHDWTEKSAKGSAAATFVISSDHKITGLSALSFSVPAKSLKSEHSGMDNNTYKALKTDKHANITYTVSSATVEPVNANTFTIKTKGKLSIAGTIQETDVVGTAKLNGDRSITVTGSKKIKMTDYKVTPPTAMLGTIKTGNDLTISYDLKLTSK